MLDGLQSEQIFCKSRHIFERLKERRLSECRRCFGAESFTWKVVLFRVMVFVLVASSQTPSDAAEPRGLLPCS